MEKKENSCRGLRTQLNIIHFDFQRGKKSALIFLQEERQLTPITLFFHVVFLEEGMPLASTEACLFPGARKAQRHLHHQRLAGQRASGYSGEALDLTSVLLFSGLTPSKREKFIKK